MIHFLDQMAGKVDQIKSSWILKLLEDRSIGFPVIVEDVKEDCGQLVNLTCNRRLANIASILVRRWPLRGPVQLGTFNVNVGLGPQATMHQVGA